MQTRFDFSILLINAMQTPLFIITYRVHHLTFFQLVIIWMVTLSSCLIWQIISFILSDVVVYTLEQRWEILRHYFKNRGNVAECMRELRTDFGRREAPSAPYLLYLVKKVKKTGILNDKPKREKPKTVRTPENIAAVAESVCEEPSISIHVMLNNWTFRKHYCDEFCIKTLVWQHTKFNWFRSSSQLTIQCVFASLSGHVIDLQNTPILAKKTFFSDEAHFDLGGYVNKQIRTHRLKSRRTQNESLFGAEA